MVAVDLSAALALVAVPVAVVAVVVLVVVLNVVCMRVRRCWCVSGAAAALTPRSVLVRLLLDLLLLLLR